MNGMMQMHQMMPMMSMAAANTANTANTKSTASSTSQSGKNQQPNFNSVLARTMERTGSFNQPQPQSLPLANQVPVASPDANSSEPIVLCQSFASSTTSFNFEEVDVSEDLFKQVELLAELLGQIQDLPQEEDIPKELLAQVEELLTSITANINALPENINGVHLVELLEQGAQVVSGAQITNDTKETRTHTEQTTPEKTEQSAQVATNPNPVAQQELKGDLSNRDNLPNPNSQEKAAATPKLSEEEDEALAQQLINRGTDKKNDDGKAARQAEGASKSHEMLSHSQRAGEQIPMFRVIGEPVVNMTERTAQVLDKQLEQLFGQQREELASSLKEQTLHNVKLIMNEGRSEITFQLYPKELGSLTLKVNVDKGLVMAKFAAASYQVKGIIESSLPQLRQSLEDLGMKDAKLEVGVGQHFLGEGRQGQAKQKASSKLRQAIEKVSYSEEQLGSKVSGLLRQDSTFEYVV